MPSLFTAAHISLSVLLATLGALVALVFTIISESGVVALLVRPLVSGLVMFVLGSVLYAVLAKKVPEVIEVFEQAPQEPPQEETGPEPQDIPAGDELTDTTTESSMERSAEYQETEKASVSTAGGKSSGVQVTKDEIIVNGMRFKNNPDVMAETVRQLMEQDES
ncbi:MAG: hypothetical protein N2Z22_03235 [Turneriella sp.]|nr:hypothetical protein [Turneriella sp.]